MKKRAHKPSIGTVYPILAEERELLMATLGAFDEDDLDFRPQGDGDERPLSVREILMHLIDADQRLVALGLQGKGPSGPGLICDESVSRIKEISRPVLGLDGIRTALERGWSVIENVLAMPAQNLTRKHSRETPINLLTILGYALVHQAQHRGQLWTYLEILGKTPPRG